MIFVYDSKFFENTPAHILERGFGSGLEDDWAGVAGVERFSPSIGANAPAITRLKSGKTILRHRSAEVVAGFFAESEKSTGQFAANCVATVVFWAHLALPVTVKTGERFHTAGD